MRLYRVGNWCHRHRVPLLPRLAKGVIFVVFSAVVPSQTAIGRDTHLSYGGLGTVLHPRAVIGDGVLVGPNVTIGGRSGHTEVPVIGDHVFIGAGARILGPVHVGDGAVIGANAVVVRDVEPRSAVGGVPAKVIKTDIDVNDFATMPGARRGVS